MAHHSVLCDASNDYIDLGASAILTTGSPFTVAWWERITSDTNDPPSRFVLFTNADPFIILRIKSTGGSTYRHMCFGPSPAANCIHSPTAPDSTNVGTWIHWIITGTSPSSTTAADYALYADNTSYAVQAGGLFGAQTTLVSRIGYNGLDQGADCRFADVRIYNRVITSAERALIYGGQPVTSGLLRWYRFLEESGTSAADSASGVTATLTSGAAFDFIIPPALMDRTPGPGFSKGPPMRGTPWFKIDKTEDSKMSVAAVAAATTVTPQMPGFTLGPIPGAPWMTGPAGKTQGPPPGVVASLPPAQQVQMPGFTTGPPLRGAPWLGRLPQMPMPLVEPPDDADDEPSVGANLTLVSRVPTPDQRLRRFTDLVADILDALIRRGDIEQIGPSEWQIAGAEATSIDPDDIVAAFAGVGAQAVFAGPGPSFRLLAMEDLPRSGVTAGQYTNATITVNQHGLVTLASSGSAASLTQPQVLTFISFRG